MFGGKVKVQFDSVELAVLGEGCKNDCLDQEGVRIKLGIGGKKRKKEGGRKKESDGERERER